MDEEAELANVARYNLLIAALATLPVVATGLRGVAVATWRSQAQGDPAATPGAGGPFECADLDGVVDAHSSSRATEGRGLPAYRLPIEVVAVLAVAVTAHLRRIPKRSQRDPVTDASRYGLIA